MEMLCYMFTNPCFTLGQYLAAVFAVCYVAPRAIEWAVRRVG
jgi:hypothetical protein